MANGQPKTYYLDDETIAIIEATAADEHEHRDSAAVRRIVHEWKAQQRKEQTA
jgi:hypothetical protein